MMKRSNVLDDAAMNENMVAGEAVMRTYLADVQEKDQERTKQFARKKTSLGAKSNYQQEKDFKDLSNFEICEQLKQKGLIDESKTIDFPVKDYFEQLIHKKSPLEKKLALVKKEYRGRMEERRQKNKMPWEARLEELDTVSDGKGSSDELE